MILRSSWHHFDHTRETGISFDDRIYENHDTYSDTKSYLDPNLNLDIENLSQAVYRYGRSFIISRGNKKDRLSVEAEFDENIDFTDGHCNFVIPRQPRLVLFNIIYGCIGETYKDKWSL